MGLRVACMHSTALTSHHALCRIDQPCGVKCTISTNSLCYFAIVTVPDDRDKPCMLGTDRGDGHVAQASPTASLLPSTSDIRQSEFQTSDRQWFLRASSQDVSASSYRTSTETHQMYDTHLSPAKGSAEDSRSSPKMPPAPLPRMQGSPVALLEEPPPGHLALAQPCSCDEDCVKLVGMVLLLLLAAGVVLRCTASLRPCVHCTAGTSISAAP